MGKIIAEESKRALTHPNVFERVCVCLRVFLMHILFLTRTHAHIYAFGYLSQQNNGHSHLFSQPNQQNYLAEER